METTTNRDRETSPPPPPDRGTPRLRYRLVHLFYAITYVGVSLATFGAVGVWPAGVFLVAWAYVFSSVSRPHALLNAVTVWVLGISLCCLMLAAHSSARGAARRMMCANNIKQIMLALQNYHDAHGMFPPTYLTDEQGKPMHSWRVLILPHLEQEVLYQAYRFDEPWNGPNNSKLLTKMPITYACPSDVRRSPGSLGPYTNYLAIVGPRTAWTGAIARSPSEFSHLSDTVMIMETQAKNVQWLEPDDFDLDAVAREFALHVDGTVVGHRSGDFFYEYPAALMVGLVDGSTRALHDLDVPSELLPLFLIDKPPDWSPSTLDSATRSPSSGGGRLRVGNCVRLAVWVLLTLWPLGWVWRRGLRSN